MKIKFNYQIVAIGLAMFSMFFGAGNIIFPLAIGHTAQDKTLFAILGLLITAVAIPFTGLIAIVLFEGDYKKFFSTLGRIPGFLMALCIITLLGPLGSTPRCIALAYSTFKMAAVDVPPLLFNAVACGIIFLFTYQRKRIMNLLGYFLTPLLLASLTYIIIKGLLTGESTPVNTSDNYEIFLHGLKEGYNTMDLLAAFFFSSMIVASLKETLKNDSSSSLLRAAVQATTIGASLLALTYVGFSYVASYHSQDLEIQGIDQLLGAITLKVMGSSAGIWVCMAIALTCLTTAIALSNVFADYVRKELFMEKISYTVALSGTLILTFIVANLEFRGISAFLGPILEICYPVLIILTLYNLLQAFLKSKEKRKPKLESLG